MKVVKIKSADGPLTKILIRSKKDTRFFKLTDLVFCCAERNYTRLHFTNGNSCLSYVSLSKVAGLLEEYGIIPVHKSYLVNVMHIQGYTSGEKYNLTLTNAVEIKVSIPKKTIMQYLQDG